MNILFVAWQDPVDRHWRPVGRLSFDGERFRFVYTKGATASNFVPFGRMDDLFSIYESKELFPLFSNRLLARSRPEYPEYLEWLNVPSEKQDDPIVLLARSGGIRGTDSLMVFPFPERTHDGKYHIEFFSHGLRYLPQETLQLLGKLECGARLYLMPDVQNEFDSLAIALRSEKPVVMAGYVPRYFAPDFQQLLISSSKDSVRVVVERVNHQAPIQLRLLCAITATWPNDFTPCSGELYMPLVSSDHRPQVENKTR